MTGRLIAIEGLDGAGKTVQTQLLASALRARGYSVTETREPGGTDLGVEIRQLVMHRDPAPAPMAELLLYLADRAEHVARVIKPAIEAGKVVLTDRFSGSTIAYQCWGRDLDFVDICDMDRVARQGVAVTLNLWLRLPFETGLRRAKGGDRFDSADIEFHRRVFAGFSEMAVAYSDWTTIDADRPVEAVHADCLSATLRVLEGR